MLFTLDKICVAYALFAGIDVCMTYKVKVGDTRKYWLIRFHKSTGGVAVSSVNKLRSQIDAFYKKEDIVPANFKSTDTNDPYSKYKTRYSEQWIAVNSELTTKYNDLRKLTVPRSSKSAVENSVKDILYTVLSLCVFRTIVPKLKEESDNVQIDKLTDPGKEEEVRNSFNRYRHNFMAIKEAVTGMATKDDVGSGEVAINQYFNTLKSKNGPLTAANKKRRQIIDKLKIFDGLFTSANAGATGVGIFTFLNQTLDADEKDKLIRAFESFSTKLQEKEKTAYKVFLDTLKYLTNIGDVRVIPIESGTLLDSIDKSMHEKPDGSKVTPEEAAAAAAEAAAAAAGPPAAAEAAAAAAGPPAAAEAAAAAAGPPPAPEAPEDKVVPIVKEEADGPRITSLKEEVIREFEAAAGAASEEARKPLLEEAERKENAYLQALNGVAVKDADNQLDTCIQVSDYGAALSLLRMKEPPRAEELIRIRDEYAVRENQGGENQGGGGGSPLSKYKYYHNPLTSFYFMFRELGWRLTQPDRDDHEGCIRLSKLLETFIFNMPKAKDQQITNYLYWLDIEKYLLYFDSKDQYTKCDPYFIDDIMFTVRDVYLGRPAEAEEAYYIIDKSIIEKIKSFSFDEVTHEEQIQENLKIMRRIIDTIYKVEEFFDAPPVTRPVNPPVTRPVKPPVTNVQRFKYTRSHRPTSLGETFKTTRVHGGSLRKHRKTKSKRRHNRKTKKRKNFVV
jgi:hypothetical protein